MSRSCQLLVSRGLPQRLWIIDGSSSIAWRGWQTNLPQFSKVHDLITCESKVQVVVSRGSYEGLFALGRHEVLTNDTWHVLLKSENVFELGGITMLFKVFRFIKVRLMLCVRKTLCDAYIICQESHNVLTTFILRPWMLVRLQLEPATSRAVTRSELLFILLLMNQFVVLFFKILLQVSQTPHGGTEQHWPSSVYQSLSHFVVCGRSRGRGKMRGCVCFTLSPTKWFEIALEASLFAFFQKHG